MADSVGLVWSLSHAHASEGVFLRTTLALASPDTSIDNTESLLHFLPTNSVDLY